MLLVQLELEQITSALEAFKTEVVAGTSSGYFSGRIEQARRRLGCWSKANSSAWLFGFNDLFRGQNDI